jgi:hypothetical protein
VDQEGYDKDKENDGDSQRYGDPSFSPIHPIILDFSSRPNTARVLDWSVAAAVISKQTVKASRNPPPIGHISLARTDNPSPVQLTAKALLDQRLGLREVGGVLDPQFEVTCAVVAEAANVTAEPSSSCKTAMSRQPLRFFDTSWPDAGCWVWTARACSEVGIRGPGHWWSRQRTD